MATRANKKEAKRLIIDFVQSDVQYYADTWLFIANNLYSVKAILDNEVKLTAREQTRIDYLAKAIYFCTGGKKSVQEYIKLITAIYKED